ncbi:MAG: urease accessory protein UreE [Magnetococcales bacterium]|nr:urease accessory protein UreE [Magnetococcales bacterium]
MNDERRVTVLVRGGGVARVPETARVTLAFHLRHKRRIRMTDDAGVPFLLDLEQATLMEDGDLLLLADGSGCIRVVAAREGVVDMIPATVEEGVRLAWHIGNRHTPLQVLPGGGLRILDDPVLADMLAGLGAQVTRCLAPFSPEGGAYGHGSRGGMERPKRSEDSIHEHGGHVHRHDHS